MEKIALGIDEAAELISVSPWTIRKWIQQGKLVPTRLGRRVCLTPDALRKFVYTNTKSSSDGRGDQEMPQSPSSQDNDEV